MTQPSLPDDFSRTREFINQEKLLQHISDKAQRYFEAMTSAKNLGKPIGSFLDEEGIRALTPFTRSNAEGGYDLFTLLMKQRIVLLEGQVDDAMASVACASLFFLRSEASGRPDDPITVHINSPGGSIVAGVAIYDTIRSIKAEITTIGYGTQASIGSILLAAGTHHEMTGNSKLLIHQMFTDFGHSTPQSDTEISANLLLERLREDLTDIYVRNTGLNHKFWNIVLQGNTWLSAEQAKKIGVIEDIVMGTAKKTLPEEFTESAANNAKGDAKVSKTAAEIMAMIESSNNNVDEDAFRTRPELVTALAQFPEFWTPSRTELEAKKAAAPPPSGPSAGGMR